jgi:hypothetical protein
MTRFAPALVLALGLALTACKNEPSSGSGFAATAPPATAATAVEPDHATPPAVPPPAGTGPAERIFSQMAKEKDSRPGAKPSVEDVLGAVAKVGITFDESKQVVAMTAGARYCVLSQNTKDGLKVVVCEYGSADDATRAQKILTEKYGAVAPTRTFALKGATSIQVTDRPDQPLTDVRRRIDEALATL